MKCFRLDNAKWTAIHIDTVQRLKDRATLRSGLGKLSPAKCDEIGMSEDEANAVEALWSLLESEDYRVIPDET